MTLHTIGGLRPVMPAPSALIDLPRIRMKGSTVFLAISTGGRAAVATTIERLIDFLDALDGDPDNEPDTDGDVSLPWGFRAEWGPIGEDDEPYTGGGNAAEPGDHDREADSSDEEPSLGWPEQIDQEQRVLTDLPAFLQGGEEDGGDMPEGEDEREDDERESDPAEAGIADADALRLFYGGDGVPTILWDGEGGGVVFLRPTEAARRAI